jgi:hypothetical protein
MKYRGIGLLFLIGGLVVWACGSFIAGKFKAKANYRSVVRITWAGLILGGAC